MPHAPTIQFPQQREDEALEFAQVLAWMPRGGGSVPVQRPADFDRDLRATCPPEPEPANDSPSAYADWRTEVMGMVGIRY